ncbi:MAG: hypothetical protein ABIG68_00340 [Acidobacteriota bacterium]
MKSKTAILGAIWLAVSASGGLGQPTTLTFREVLELRTPGNVSVTDDARLVAYSVREVHWSDSRFRSHIWILNTDTGESRQFTRGETTESEPQFSPDGGLLAFISSRADTDSDAADSDPSQVWLIRTDGGEARKLTSAQIGPDHESLSSSALTAAPMAA